MAVRFDADGEAFIRSGGLGLTSNTLPLTVCGWFKRVADRNTFTNPLNIDNGSGSEGEQISSNSGGDVAQLTSNNGQGIVNGPTYVNDTWFFMAGTVQSGTNGRNFRWKADGAASLTTGTATTISPDQHIGLTRISIGDGPFSGEWFNGSIVCVRLWNAILSESELLAEADSATPVRTTNLQGAWRLSTTSDTADASGNSRPLTGGTGATTDADEPTDIAAADIVEAITPALEADSAQPITVATSFTQAITPAVETDAAQAIGVATQLTQSVAAAAEIDAAGQTLFYSFPVAPAVEHDSAQAISSVTGTTQAITPAVEADSAQPFGIATQVTQAIVLAVETDSAQPIGVATQFSQAITPAVEHDSAQAFGLVTELTQAVIVATEIDTAQTLDVAGQDTIAITPALETDAALPITVVIDNVIAVAPALETDTAQALGVVIEFTQAITPATEADSAQAINVAAQLVQAVATAVEIDLAPIVVPFGGETAFGDIWTFLGTATVDRFTGTVSPDRFPGDTATADRFSGTVTASQFAGDTATVDRFIATARLDRFVGANAQPDRWFVNVDTHDRFHQTRFFREGGVMALNIVPIGPYTQNEVPEALIIRWLRTHADGTTSGLPLFNQTPAWTVNAHIDKPSGAEVTRLCEILDPATLTTEFPDPGDQGTGGVTDGDDGWVRMTFAATDLDELTTGDLYLIQLTADNGTLLLKTQDAWQPTVHTGPAAEAVLV